MTIKGQEQAEVSDLPEEGYVLAGKYRIDRVLGKGAMGVVVAAHHITLRQKVAIKLLLPAAAARGDATERFLREARAASSIQSEHVARVSDVGTLDTGMPYMVMELLTGSDLGQVLEERGPLPIDEAVDYVLQACEAIAEAHSLGLIHRDLKPSNLFVASRADGSPLVKVLDFGLSKATKPDPGDASLTASHVVMGSPFYMSPEQFRRFKAIDARADIWSMGVILYQLLTGVCPWQSESLGELFIAIGGDPAPSMRELRPEIPEELEAAIFKCLEKSVDQRTQTVAELARALAPFGAEDSYISVERIARVLGDTTPFSRAPSRSRSSEAEKPAAIAKPEAPPSAPTELPVVELPKAMESAGPPKAMESAGPPKAMESADLPKAMESAGPPKATESAGPPANVDAAPPAKSGRVGVVVVGMVAAVVVAIVAVRAIGGGGGSTPPAPTAPSQAAPAPRP